MVIVPIRFPEKMYENLRALSELTNKSMAQIVRESLDKEIKIKPKKIRNKLKYVNPLLEMVKRAKKLPNVKDHYPHLSDDELLYGGPKEK